MQTRKIIVTEHDALVDLAIGEAQAHAGRPEAPRHGVYRDRKVLAEEVTRLRAIVDPLNKLRANKGASVLVCCDDPAPDGVGSRIEVTDKWTDWTPLQFVGANLTETLQTASGIADAAERTGE